MKTRWFLLVGILGVLVMPAATLGQWQAAVGAQSPDKGRQALAFLPNELWIHAGDSVTWNFETDTDHTLTFLQTTPVPQVRPPRAVGCPGTTGDGAPFDGAHCVNSGSLFNGKSFTVVFPTAGNYKLVCLVHSNMTGVVHVLPLAVALPHGQDFYNDEAGREANALLSDHEHGGNRVGEDSDADAEGLSAPTVNAGTGEIVATGGGSHTLSVMRFMRSKIVIHAGQTVEWTNLDPVTAHTITFGVEPGNPIPPSANVTLDVDLARHATISSPTDNVHSGFIVAAPQDRIGLVQSPLPPLGNVTRFRATFTQPGVFPYICALHDTLGMKGTVVVLP